MNETEIINSINAGERIGLEKGSVYLYAERVDAQATYEGYDPEHYTLSFHDPMMPAHDVQHFETIESLLEAMGEWYTFADWHVIEME